MRQQINLLDAVTTYRRFYLTFDALQFAVIILVGLLVLLGIAHPILHEFNKRDVIALTQKKNALYDELMQLTKNQNTTVQGRISVLDETIKTRQIILNKLTSYNNRKLSFFLESISKNTPDHLWLDQIIFIPDSAMIQINGFTTNADLVPLFVHQLKNANIFTDEKSISIVINAVKNNRFSFEIKTKPNDAVANVQQTK